MIKASERRKEQRIPLDTLYFVNISFGQEEFITCMVLDISSGGLMVALPPSFKAPVPGISQTVLIHDVPFELLHVLPNNTNSKVMWSREGLCGLAFEETLNDISGALLTEDLSEDV